MTVVVNTIPRAEIAVEMAGAVGDGVTDDSPAIQAAIDAVAAQGGGTVRCGPRPYAIKNQLLVSTSNVMIEGTGPAAYRTTQAAIKNSASTTLRWAGATGGTMVKFESPAGGARQHGGGMRNIMLDGNNFSAAKGFHMRTWQHGLFERLYAFACSDEHYDLDITGNVLSEGPYDNQRNTFMDCVASTRGGSGAYLTSTATGFLLRGRSDYNPGANTCFNYFYNCTGLMSAGPSFLLEATDNNHFFACTGSAQRDPAQYGMVLASADQDSYGQNGHARFNYIYGCQMSIFVRAGQNGGGSSHSNFIILSRANNTPLPVFETAAGGSAPASATVIDTRGNFYLDGAKVLGARQTGFTAMTGIADKSSAFATSTATPEQLAMRVKALQDAMAAHGLIGA